MIEHTLVQQYFKDTMDLIVGIVFIMKDCFDLFMFFRYNLQNIWWEVEQLLSYK